MIKKSITTTTLLVASATLASAGFVAPDISWDDFSNVTPVASTTVNNSASTSSIFFANTTNLPTKSGNALVFDGTADVIFVKKASGAALSYSNTTGTFSFTTSSITLPTTSVDHSVLATIQDSASNQYGIGINSEGYLVAVYTSDGSIYQSYKSSTTITASDTNTFTFVLDSSTGLRAYVNGQEFLSGCSGLKYTTNAPTTKQMIIGGTSTPKECTGMTVSNIYIHSTSLSKEDVAATFTAGGLIPEPSAFGLLSGVGAIALAVSRRRRKQ